MWPQALVADWGRRLWLQLVAAGFGRQIVPASFGVKFVAAGYGGKAVATVSGDRLWPLALVAHCGRQLWWQFLAAGFGGI